MPILLQKFISRSDLQANKHVMYAFGDNLEEAGFGGQAKEMRGEPNALGIPTKASPYMFLSDVAHYKLVTHRYNLIFEQIEVAMKARKLLVWPLDGIGTGLADLKNKAPMCWAYLEAKRHSLFEGRLLTE